MVNRVDIKDLRALLNRAIWDKAHIEQWSSVIDELESLRAENASLNAASLRVTCAGKHGHNPQILDCPKCVEEERDALAARVEALQSWYDDHTERECAICPEDVSCTEYIDLLLDTVEASTAKNDALAALVRLLVHSIRKHSPDNETARKAMDYLRRHELQGSPLRTTILSPAPDAAKPNNQQEQP